MMLVSWLNAVRLSAVAARVGGATAGFRGLDVRPFGAPPLPGPLPQGERGKTSACESAPGRAVLSSVASRFRSLASRDSQALLPSPLAGEGLGERGRPAGAMAYAPAAKTTLAAALLTTLLTACSGITIQAAAPTSTRNLPTTASAPAAAQPSARPASQTSAAEGLKLARLLRDQGRYEGAAGVYAQLEQRKELRPLELLEYASVAAHVQAPQESLGLFGRARRALNEAGIALSPAASATLCNGLGRARLALGQRDAALADFDCALAAEPDNLSALNAKGVLLDARGEHKEAQRLLARAYELDPADFRLLNNLALSHLASGDTAQATRLLAHTHVAELPTLKLNLAFAYTLEGDEARAREALLTVMSSVQAERTLADFTQRRARIRAGAAVADELLAASRQALPLAPAARGQESRPQNTPAQDNRG